MRSPISTVAIPVDQAIPCNQQAENGLLSSILNDPDLFGKLPSDVTDAYFWCPGCRLVFSAARSAWIAKQRLDFRSLEVALKSSGNLEMVGGAQSLDDLFSFVPSGSNWSYYLQLCALAYRRRETYLAARHLAYQAQNGDCPTLEALDACLANFSSHTAFGGCAGHETKNWRDQLFDWLDHASTAAERRRANLIRFGIPELDNQICPVEAQDMMIISGLPSSGKTALVGQLVDQVASAGGRVVWFSLEMGEKSIMGRQMAHRAEIPLQALRTGYLTKEQLERLHGAIERTSALPITLIDRRSSITDIASELRRLTLGSQKPIKLVIVDYIQLISCSGMDKQKNREQEIAFLSGTLKGLAKELETVMVVLSQVNKDGTTRDSAAVEQDADVILYVREVYGKDKEFVEDQRKVFIKKQRNGIRGSAIRCKFIGEYLKFEALNLPKEPAQNIRSPHNSD